MAVLREFFVQTVLIMCLWVWGFFYLFVCFFLSGDFSFFVSGFGGGVYLFLFYFVSFWFSLIFMPNLIKFTTKNLILFSLDQIIPYLLVAIFIDRRNIFLDQ